MVPDRIEREIFIDAPLETVWAIVTEPEHVGAWFSDSAEIELRPGGDTTLTWEEYGSVRARVEKVEPPTSFSFRWARPVGAEPRAGNSTLVELSLSAEGEGTRLRVVESGFRELERSEEEKAKYAGENERGWEHELGELREYASTQMRPSARQ
ncbi:MAG TPA: SRPBCC domain-containing protein [Gaiellaceae bacterium]|nr:SRPBCC domain-containing protein [Gaiellaceae bacterium]